VRVWGWWSLSPPPPAAVIGEFGRRAFRTAQAILERGWDSVVASDAHDTHLRPSRMREAFKFLKAHYGRQTAERLMVQGPERLLAERAMLRLDGGWLLAH